MTFFRNKHVITAMIVSPLLAILAYFAVDLVVKEEPQVAVAGQAYPLVAKSNCRFNSGGCDLENASFKINMQVNQDSGELELTSSHSLQKVTIGFVELDGKETQPLALESRDGLADSWFMKLPVGVNSESIARLAVQAGGATYFAETTMLFSEYKTTFEKDFRK